MRWEVQVARMGARSGAYRVLVEKSEGKKPFGRPGLDERKTLRRGCSGSGM